MATDNTAYTSGIDLNGDAPGSLASYSASPNYHYVADWSALGYGRNQPNPFYQATLGLEGGIQSILVTPQFDERAPGGVPLDWRLGYHHWNPDTGGLEITQPTIAINQAQAVPTYYTAQLPGANLQLRVQTISRQVGDKTVQALEVTAVDAENKPITVDSALMQEVLRNHIGIEYTQGTAPPAHRLELRFEVSISNGADTWVSAGADQAGFMALLLTDQGPVPQSAEYSGNAVVIAFANNGNRLATDFGNPAPEAFEVFENGQAVAVQSAFVIGERVVLTLERPLQTQAELRVQYTDGPGDQVLQTLQTWHGNDASSFNIGARHNPSALLAFPNFIDASNTDASATVLGSVADDRIFLGNSLRPVQAGDGLDLVVLSGEWDDYHTINWTSGGIEIRRNAGDPSVFFESVEALQLDDSVVASHNGHFYVVDFSYPDWPTAQAMARDDGGYLASITSAAENDFVAGLMRTALIGQLGLGATNGGADGKWRWDNGELVYFTDWGSNQPDNYNGDERFITMALGNWLNGPGDLAGWNDSRNLQGPFLIEIGNTQTSPVDAQQGSTGADNRSLSQAGLYEGLDGNDTVNGSPEFDLLYGDAGDDRLNGLGGNDSLVGGSGNDGLDGGDGHDTLHGGSGNDSLSGGAGNDRLLGEDGPDTLLGGDGVDNLYGGADNDSLSGGAQDDYLVGGPGQDTLDGGPGIDTTSYRDATGTSLPGGGVSVNLATGLATDNWGNTDTLISIEQVWGSEFADLLVGGHPSNGTATGSPYDGFEGFQGFGGNDTIDGGPGFDRVSYDRSPAPVWVQLNGSTDGSAQDGFGGTDVLRNIEEVRGSSFNDTLMGSDGAAFESFEGRGGDDHIDGLGGVDRASYSTSPSAVHINLATGMAQDGWGGNDRLSNIEHLRGSEHNDLLTGNGGDNRLEGLGGNDHLIGGLGADALLGGAGDDTLDGGGQRRFSRLEGSQHDAAVYSDATGPVVVELSADGRNGTANGAGVGSDLLIDIELVIGSNFGDLIRGSNRSDSELFRGGLGDDTLYGGASVGTDLGNNLVDYRDANGPVSASLNNRNGSASGADGNDVFYGFMGLLGGAHADSLSGDEHDNFIEGRRGNDTLDGGAGRDTASYGNASGPVRVSLAEGLASGADGEDLLIGFENIRGSHHSDQLLGDGGDNLIDGFDGDDEIRGGGGNDDLHGGRGKDTAVYSGLKAEYQISTLSDGRTEVQDLVAGRDGSDLLSGIELLRFSDGEAEIDPGPSGNPTTRPLSAEDITDPSTQYFNPENQHIYQVVLAPLRWGDASTYAAGLQIAGVRGHLVTITSAEEQRFIDPLASRFLDDSGEGVAWIGASDLASEGDWRWEAGPEAGKAFWLGKDDGQAVGGAYTNWHIPFLDNWAGGDPIGADYGVVHAAPSRLGQWDDGTFQNAYGFIVEYSGLAYEAPATQQPSFQSVDPAGTWLADRGEFSRDRDAPAPTTVRLTDIGVQAGDLMGMRRVGDYLAAPGDGFADDRSDLLAVFLDANGQAIAPVVYRGFTSKTQGSGLTTDIGADFSVAPGHTRVLVPDGAVSIAFSADDTFYSNNTDPDQDYGVWLGPIGGFENSGNDLLFGSTGDDRLVGGSGDDVVFGGTGQDTLIGGQQTRLPWPHDIGADYDRLDYTASPGVLVDLSQRSLQIRGQDGVSHFEGFEEINGGWSQPDLITGRTSQGVADTGLGGNAIYLMLNGGSDTVDMDPYGDQQPWADGALVGYHWSRTAIDLVYVGATATVSYGASGSQLAGADTLVHVGVIGDSRFDDRFDLSRATLNQMGHITNPYDDASWHALLLGRGGSDTVIGNGLTNINYGAVTHSSSGTGLYIDLMLGQADLSHLSTNGTALGTLYFEGVRSVTGTRFNDSLLGGYNDQFESFRGDAGDDFIDGRSGYDRVDYRWSSGAIAVDLGQGMVYGESHGTDTLRSIEAVRGSLFDDFYDASGFMAAQGAGANVGSIHWGLNEFEGMGGNDTILGNGNTRISYAGAMLAVHVDLGQGFADALNPAERQGEAYSTLGRDSFSAVSAVHGSVFDDLLVGGGPGRQGYLDGIEQFIGGAGNDTIDGAGGDDLAVYSGSPGPISVNMNLSSQQVQDDGWGDQDTLIDIQGIVGSAYNDTVSGGPDAGAYLLFVPGRGADVFFGGAGTNEIDYSNSPSGVVVRLGGWVGKSGDLPVGYTGSALDGWGDIDLFSNVQNAEGSFYNDLIVGDGGNNVLDGRGGNDTIDGGDGIDTLEFNQATVGIHVDLAQGRVFSDGQGLGDAGPLEGTSQDWVSNIENVNGGGADDLIVGDGGDNELQGLRGNDTLVGGDGMDTALFRGIKSEYLISTLSDGRTEVQDLVADRDGTDQLSGMEWLRFSDGEVAVEPGQDGTTLRGQAYHWKSHQLLADVKLALSDAHASSPSADLFDLREARYDESTQSVSVQLWANPGSNIGSLGFTAESLEATGARFVSALPEGWTEVFNAGNPQQAKFGAFNTNLGANNAQPLFIGTLELDLQPYASVGSLRFNSIEVGNAEPRALGFSWDTRYTDGEGRFAFADLSPGSHALSASRAVTGDDLSAVSPADAFAALMLAVGLNPNADPDGLGPQSAAAVSPYQFIAADINQSGAVTSADALGILRMAVGVESAPAGGWVFLSEKIDFWNENANNGAGEFTLNRRNLEWDNNSLVSVPPDATANLVGVLRGDVNGNWRGDANSPVMPASHFQQLIELVGMPPAQWGLDGASLL